MLRCHDGGFLSEVFLLFGNFGPHPPPQNRFPLPVPSPSPRPPPAIPAPAFNCQFFSTPFLTTLQRTRTK